MKITSIFERSLLLFFFLFFVIIGKSQNYLGIAGGGGLTGDVGLRAAVVAEFPVNSFMSFQSEVVFVQRANAEIIRRLDPDRDYRQVVLSYLELPLMVRFKLDLDAVELFALLGIKAGYSVDMRANYVEEGSLSSEKLSFNTNKIDRFDVGLSLGVGLEKVISKYRKIFIDYRYYLGLYNIDEVPNAEIFNQGSVVNLGFLIPIGKLEKE